jgi:hypothetical protein
MNLAENLLVGSGTVAIMTLCIYWKNQAVNMLNPGLKLEVNSRANII